MAKWRVRYDNGREALLKVDLQKRKDSLAHCSPDPNSIFSTLRVTNAKSIRTQDGFLILKRMDHKDS